MTKTWWSVIYMGVGIGLLAFACSVALGQSQDLDVPPFPSLNDMFIGAKEVSRAPFTCTTDFKGFVTWVIRADESRYSIWSSPQTNNVLAYRYELKEGQWEAEYEYHIERLADGQVRIYSATHLIDSRPCNFLVPKTQPAQQQLDNKV